MKYLMLSLMLSVLVLSTCYSQDMVKGRLSENKTNIALQGIKVENLKSRLSTVSDFRGTFAIKAGIGDRLVFSGFNYQPDTIYLTNLKYLEVFLTLQQNMLKEIKVSTPEIKTGSLTAPAATGPFDSHSVLYQTDGNGNYIGGITIKIWDWKKDENKKLKEKHLAADEQTEQQILTVFSAANIKNYLPLTGQELDNFVILYIPDVKTYTSVKFNLLLYLTDCYTQFNKIPIEKRRGKSYVQLIGKK